MNLANRFSNDFLATWTGRIRGAPRATRACQDCRFFGSAVTPSPASGAPNAAPSTTLRFSAMAEIKSVVSIDAAAEEKGGAISTKTVDADGNATVVTVAADNVATAASPDKKPDASPADPPALPGECFAWFRAVGWSRFSLPSRILHPTR